MKIATTTPPRVMRTPNDIIQTLRDVAGELDQLQGRRRRLTRQALAYLGLRRAGDVDAEHFEAGYHQWLELEQRLSELTQQHAALQIAEPWVRRRAAAIGGADNAERYATFKAHEAHYHDQTLVHGSEIERQMELVALRKEQEYFAHVAMTTPYQPTPADSQILEDLD